MNQRHKALVWLAVRLAVALAALAWTFSRVSANDLVDAASRISGWAALGAVTLTTVNLGLGAVRWRVLLHAYGAATKPSLLFLWRIYIVGFFYNTLLPGNVGGDVVRGHATRTAFEGGAGGYVIVVIERVFGLAGLLLLGASVLVVHPIGGVAHMPLLAAAGVVVALAAAVSPMIARKLAPKLPGRLGRLAASMPAVRAHWALVVVLLLSVGTQAMVALTGHVLIASIAPTVVIGDSLVLVPLAMIAIYFPFTVAGLGVREAALVTLLGLVGVSSADAAASSLAFLASQLVVALAGGLIHVIWPVSSSDSPTLDRDETPQPRHG